MNNNNYNQVILSYRSCLYEAFIKNNILPELTQDNFSREVVCVGNKNFLLDMTFKNPNKLTHKDLFNFIEVVCPFWVETRREADDALYWLAYEVNISPHKKIERRKLNFELRDTKTNQTIQMTVCLMKLFNHNDYYSLVLYPTALTDKEVDEYITGLKAKLDLDDIVDRLLMMFEDRFDYSNWHTRHDRDIVPIPICKVNDLKSTSENTLEIPYNTTKISFTQRDGLVINYSEQLIC